MTKKDLGFWEDLLTFCDLQCTNKQQYLQNGEGFTIHKTSNINLSFCVSEEKHSGCDISPLRT